MDLLSPQWDVFGPVAATLMSEECLLAINILNLCRAVACIAADQRSGREGFKGKGHN